MMHRYSLFQYLISAFPPTQNGHTKMEWDGISTAQSYRYGNGLDFGRRRGSYCSTGGVSPEVLRRQNSSLRHKASLLRHGVQYHTFSFKGRIPHQHNPPLATNPSEESAKRGNRHSIEPNLSIPNRMVTQPDAHFAATAETRGTGTKH